MGVVRAEDLEGGDVDGVLVKSVCITWLQWIVDVRTMFPLCVPIIYVQLSKCACMRRVTALELWPYHLVARNHESAGRVAIPI